MKFLFLLLLLVIFFFLSTFSLLDFPQIWPDEAYLADVASNITKEDRFGTDLWGGTIVGIHDHLYWYPPIYPTILAIWFKIFGFSIESMRILSVTISSIFIIIFYFYSRIFFSSLSGRKAQLVSSLLVLFLIADQVFLKASRMGRPEILVLLLGTLSLYVLRISQTKPNKYLYALTGLILSLAVLTHLLVGVIFFFAVAANLMLLEKSKIIKFHNILLLCFLIPILIWFISIYPNYSIFLNQLSLQIDLRRSIESILDMVLHSPPLEPKIIYTIYIILSLIFLVFSLLKRSSDYLTLSVTIILSWIVILVGKLEWYMPYLVVFLYLASFILVTKVSSSYLKKTVLILLISLFILNLKFDLDQFGAGYSYYQLGQDTKNIVPEDKTVYLSTVPDLFFIFKDRNKIYEFPTVQPKIDSYMDILNNSDYIILNIHFEFVFMGDLLSRYIELNRFKEDVIIRPSLAAIKIIELKPKSKRIQPEIPIIQ